MLCPNCGADVTRDVLFCRSCGAPVPRKEERPMIWYHILVFGLLIFSAVLNSLIGLAYATGLWYVMFYDVVPSFSYPGIVYAAFPQMRIIDIAYGAACIFLGVLQIVTRQTLLYRKRIAPKLLLVCYALAVLLPFTYFILGGIVLDGYEMTSVLTLCITTPGGIAMLVFNAIYFHKRKAYFDR